MTIKWSKFYFKWIFHPFRRTSSNAIRWVSGRFQVDPIPPYVWLSFSWNVKGNEREKRGTWWISVKILFRYLPPWPKLSISWSHWWRSWISSETEVISPLHEKRTHFKLIQVKPCFAILDFTRVFCFGRIEGASTHGLNQFLFFDLSRFLRKHTIC